MNDAPKSQPSLGDYIKTINQSHYEAIATVEIVKPILYNKSTSQKFDQSYAAHVHNFMQGKLTEYGVLTLVRLWDQGDEALSIPNLMERLNQEEEFEAVIKRRRAGQLAILSSAEAKNWKDEQPDIFQTITGMAKKDADEQERKTRDALAKAAELTEQIESSQLLETLRNWRHKSIAHSLTETRMEKKASKTGTEIGVPKWGDMESLLRKTSQVVVELNLLVDDLSIFPAETHRVWKAYAKEFWERFS